MGNEFNFDSVRDALAREIERAGIAPTTLSQKVGKSKSLVKEILEEGRDIKLSTLARLASALDIAVADLLPEDNGRPVMVPLFLPSEDALTAMFQGILPQALDVDEMDERARRLARSFPSAFRAALLPHIARDADEERIPAKRPRAGAGDRPST